MSSSLPEGALLRRPTEADADAVAQLMIEYGEPLGAPADITADELRRFWEEFDLAADTWVVELDRRVVGYADVSRRNLDPIQGDGYVHPDAKGRGIGSALLSLVEQRARELGGPRLHTGTLYADEAARALLEARGFRFVRAFLRMGIRLDAPPPEPAVPEGLRLEQATLEDDHAVYAAAEEAFLDHWEHHPRPYEEWQRRCRDSDRSLWWIARDGDEIAGVAVNDENRFGGGWVWTLGTRRPWRGRGVGRALLLASFGEFHRRGERFVQLAVDGESPTGAVRLYESVGMHVVWRADVWEKSLA